MIVLLLLWSFIAINLNPYQGLKLIRSGGENKSIRNCNQPKPLSGIETADSILHDPASSGNCNQPKPLSGIETAIALPKLTLADLIAINLNPYQGLKQLLMRV